MPLLANEEKIRQRIGHCFLGQLQRIGIVVAQSLLQKARALLIGLRPVRHFAGERRNARIEAIGQFQRVSPQGFWQRRDDASRRSRAVFEKAVDAVTNAIGKPRDADRATARNIHAWQIDIYGFGRPGEKQGIRRNLLQLHPVRYVSPGPRISRPSEHENTAVHAHWRVPPRGGMPYFAVELRKRTTPPVHSAQALAAVSPRVQHGPAALFDLADLAEIDLPRKAW